MAYFKHTQQDEEPQRYFLRPVQDDDYADEDEPEDEEALYEMQEARARREGNLRLAFGLGDMLGVVLGVVVILLLLAVLISLINWVHADMNQFLSLLNGRV